MAMREHERILAAATRWAERDARVRALLLKGSLAGREADERSDVDLLVLAEAGRLKELWAARRSIAEGLGGWLGGFDEVAWQAPHTFIGFCAGPVKVDFFFQEDAPDADPWLRDGFRPLFDPEGVAGRLRERLAADPPLPDLSEFDTQAWDWLWFAHLKLRHESQRWLLYVELVKFVETMLVTGFNVLTAEPWRGVWRLDERLPEDVLAQVRAALPASPTDGELRRATSSALSCYLMLRRRLADERCVPLNDELAAEVLPILRSASPSTAPP